MNLTRLEFAQHPRPPSENCARGASSTPRAASSVISKTFTWTRRAPTLGELHAAPEEGLQRAARESGDKNRGGGAWE